MLIFVLIVYIFRSFVPKRGAALFDAAESVVAILIYVDSALRDNA